MRRGSGRGAVVTVVGVAALVVATLLVVVPRPVRAAADAPACTISAKLVNSCRPWIGAESNGYGKGPFAARMLEHENRIGRQLDIVHAYMAAGATALSTDQVTMAKRPGTIGLYNWRVSLDWKKGGGNDGTVNAQIDQMATSIKSLGSTRIMLAIYHEPELGLSPGGSPSCPTVRLSGSAGTAADYVAMWHNVRERFDALGVTNVVWVMDYMGYTTSFCLARDLWPGNDYVDWVMWDPYPYPSLGTWTSVVRGFYDHLTANSDATHDFLSKPWGLAEYGYLGADQSKSYGMYDDAAKAVRDNVFPKLKAYVVWDNYTSTSHDDRVGYTQTHVLDPVEQQHYNALVNDPAFVGTAVPEPTDMVAPSVVRTSPEDGATADGTLEVTGTASDDVGVESVQLLVDGDPAASSTPDADGDVTIAWNTATVANGAHSLRLWARDTSGNTAVSDAVSVLVHNVDDVAPSTPGDLTSSWSSPSQVTLHWTASTDNLAVSGYRIHRDGEPFTIVGPETTFVDEDVENLSAHSYAVSALDAAGNESAPSEASEVTTGDDTAPSAPSTDVGLTGPTEATVSWTAATDNDAVAGYRVYRDDTLVADLGPSARSSVDPGLDDATSYGYRVSAYDTAGNVSEPGDPVVLAVPDVTAPSTPTGLTAVSGSTTVALSWTGSADNVGVTGYTIYRDGLPVATSLGTGTTWTDAAPVGNTAHRYTVTARDAVGNESGKSNEVARTVDSTPPSTPLNLRATSTSTAVALAWNPSSDNVAVSAYVVYRDGLPKATLSGASTSWTDSAPVGTTLHRYRVTARDAADNESAPSNEVARTIPDTTAPSVPTRLAGSLSGSTVRLTWTASTDNTAVTGYTVYRGGVAIGTATTPSYTDAAAPLGRIATYTVRARDAAGNSSAASSAVNVSVPADKTAPTAPGSLRATAGATGTRRVTLTWTASSDNVGVTGYYLYRANAKYKLLGKVTSYVDTGLKAGTRYTYKVYALDGAGNWSGASTTVSATAR